MAAGSARPAPSPAPADRRRRAGPISSTRSTRSAPASGRIARSSAATGASSATATAGRCACSGSSIDADRRALRQRYLDLVRRYHPDKNGGDRSHEKALQAVIEAYTALKGRPAFA